LVGALTLLWPVAKLLISSLVAGLSGGAVGALNPFGTGMVVAGLVSGLLGLRALLFGRERSALVWAALLLGLLTLLLVIRDIFFRP
jgi:hypothetical protein